MEQDYLKMSPMEQATVEAGGAVQLPGQEAQPTARALMGDSIGSAADSLMESYGSVAQGAMNSEFAQNLGDFAQSVGVAAAWGAANQLYNNVIQAGQNSYDMAKSGVASLANSVSSEGVASTAQASVPSSGGYNITPAQTFSSTSF